MIRNIRLVLAILTASCFLIAQSSEVVSIEFGSARIALGMPEAQVKDSLIQGGRRLVFDTVGGDNPGAVYQGQRYEGQVTFNRRNRQVVYAAYHYPATRDATVLAQQIAAAVTRLDRKACVVANHSGQGADGSLSATYLDCGPKRLTLMTAEVIGGERTTHVQVSIGDLTATER